MPRIKVLCGVQLVVCRECLASYRFACLFKRTEKLGISGNFVVAKDDCIEMLLMLIVVLHALKSGC